MRSPVPLRSADTPSPHHRFDPHHHFHSTIALRKLRHFNFLILLLRLATFCFSLVSAVFMLTNSRGSSSPHWYDFDAFRYVFAATAVVTIYSLFESGASVWEISVGATLLPEIVQVWFDFGHDQLFAYLLLSAGSTAAETAKNMSGGDTCTVSNAFCVQSRIAIGLGFGGFLFLGLSSLLSGFRVVCFIINGTRFHI